MSLNEKNIALNVVENQVEPIKFPYITMVNVSW